MAPQGEAPEALGHDLVLELLLRVWQRSDQGVLQRAAGADSLLLVELPMERLPEDVPRLKADWLNTGDTAKFKAGLQAFSPRAWTVSIENSSRWLCSRCGEGCLLPDVHGHGIALAFERVDPMQDAGENSTRRFTTGGIEITERNVGNGPWYPFSIGGLSATSSSPPAQLTWGKTLWTTTEAGNGRCVGLPARPCRCASRDRCWCCTTTRLRHAEMRTVLPEGAGPRRGSDRRRLAERLRNRAGRTGFGSPAELSIAVVLLLEPPVDVTEVAKVLEGVGGQKVVDDVQHGQASPAACACRRIK